MEAALAVRFPLEMLHGVGDVNFIALDPRILERAIKDFASRPDKRLSSEVLLVARLLTQEQLLRRSAIRKMRQLRQSYEMGRLTYDKIPAAEEGIPRRRSGKDLRKAPVAAR